MAGINEERTNADHPGRYHPRRRWIPDRPHKTNPGTGDIDSFSDESLYHPSSLGCASANPASIPAGSCSFLELTYTAGKAGLPEGTLVRFGMRGQNPLGALPRECSIQQPDGLVLKRQGMAFLLEKGGMREGDQVTLRWDAFSWTPVAGRREIKVSFTLPGDIPEQRLPEPVVLNITPVEPDTLEITLPCTFRNGDTLRGRVSVRDRFDNRVDFSGCTLVDCAGQQVPVALSHGIGDFQVQVSKNETVRASASLREVSETVVSNPSVCVSDDYQLFVGDLHTHDFLSEAEGYPDSVYRWAMDDRRFDFVSVVPQSHGWHDNETWTITKYMNERHLKEGEFVTLLGFEWQHTGYGDKVIHYLGGDQPYLPVDDARYSSPGRLYSALRTSDAFIISHHPSYPRDNWVPATDYDAIDTQIERVIEIWSMHGSSEGYHPDDRPLVGQDPSNTVMEALRKGVRLGFVGGSDTHSGRPGGAAREPLPYWGGMAAVWAKDFTRRSIFQAIQSRRTYALTRARIVLRMLVNGAWMGSELPFSDHAQIRIEAWAPANIRKVEIVKNTHLLQAFGPYGDTCTLEFEDATQGPAFYHCRVTLENGELAVCSPVWIG